MEAPRKRPSGSTRSARAVDRMRWRVGAGCFHAAAWAVLGRIRGLSFFLFSPQPGELPRSGRIVFSRFPHSTHDPQGIDACRFWLVCFRARGTRAPEGTHPNATFGRRSVVFVACSFEGKFTGLVSILAVSSLKPVGLIGFEGLC